MKNISFKIFTSIFILLCLSAVFAGYITDVDPNYVDLFNANETPNKNFIFGTDAMGRDIFSRTLYGLRTSLMIGLLAGFLCTLLAFIYAYMGSFDKLYTICERLIDMFLSIPNILFIMIFSSVSSGGVFIIMIIIAICSWMQSAKVLISNIRLHLKTPYVLQAKSNGATTTQIIFFEILPNLKNILISLFTINVAHSISLEATLSFFGIGTSLEVVSLGLMIQESIEALFIGSWWVFLYPGLVLLFLVLSVVFISAKFENKGIKI